MTVRTHTFNGVKYDIDEVTEMGGFCIPETKELTVLRGSSIKALGSLLEEGLHALDIPDRYLHKKDKDVKIGESMSRVDDLARFVWRMGWRKK